MKVFKERLKGERARRAFIVIGDESYPENVIRKTLLTRRNNNINKFLEDELRKKMYLRISRFHINCSRLMRYFLSMFLVSSS